MWFTSRDDVIKDVLQPGETKRFEVVDTFVRAPFQDATFEIANAEGLLPADGVAREVGAD